MKSKLKLVLIGLFAGLINGLFGAGGGLLVVPSLIYIVDLEEHKAHGTAITIILPLCIISTFIYFNNNLIDLSTAALVAIGSTFGGYIGARTLRHVPNNILRKSFSILIIYISLRMILS